MKRILLILSVVFAISACSPQAYTMLLDMRYPSASGLDLADKDIAVVCLDNSEMRDTMFVNAFADGLAQGLDIAYSGGKRCVGLYSLKMDPEGDYSCKDTLVGLLLDLDVDALLLTSMPVFEEPEGEKITATVNIYGYDSMGRKDEVKSVTVSDKVYFQPVPESMFASDAQYMGLSASKQFADVWKSEQYTLIYYDFGVYEWITAAEAADDMQWQTALDQWMNLTKSGTSDMKSSAMYDCALACYMLGEYELALEWLDLSDKTFPISLSKGLRSRVKARL